MGKTLTLATTPLEYAILPKHEKDEIPDRLAIMLFQEENEYQVFDYLAANEELRKKAAKPVDADCRVKMCEWCYQVVDFCKFRRETVGIGMSYLDRYLCTETGKNALGDRKEYQLVAMTCLYIAIKLHEPLEMETSLLADLSRGCYTEMEFANMEKKILEAVQWRVSGPTPLAFVLHFLTFLPDTLNAGVEEAIWDYARYQTELAIAEHAFVKLKPSIVGMAALLNAMEGMDTILLPERVQERFVRTVVKYTSMDIREVDKAQTRLSNMLINLLSEEHAKKYEKLVDEDSDEEVDLSDEEEEDYEEPMRPVSPVSVTRKKSFH
ncbi:cyclin-like protein [Nitzschia inconspicua]|uniref:Cyclin-like protein n=1 Tax=Nitzschia inconspicua TaxID=303405 RepID=A0A9K3P7Q1_9STRA|nr:cyclin-like protein [Nitzschia inconspicua]KAG7360330.1 cyclin-like protein [Nitzschia inconspicua]